VFEQPGLANSTENQDKHRKLDKEIGDKGEGRGDRPKPKALRF